MSIGFMADYCFNSIELSSFSIALAKEVLGDGVGKVRIIRAIFQLHLIFACVKERVWVSLSKRYACMVYLPSNDSCFGGNIIWAPYRVQ